MKYLPLLIFVILLSCKTNTNSGKTEITEQSPEDNNNENYTGVKKFYDGDLLIKETTFKGGEKNGINKNYYSDGKLKRTIWYSNGLRSDTAKWYRKNGTVYRATPYVNDKIHGLQIKYYESGRVWAKIPYKNGMRLPGLKEYYDNGLEAGKDPTIKYKINSANYTNNGTVTIVLSLSNNSKNVKYYTGALSDGAFNKEKAKNITASAGMGYIALTKTQNGGTGYVDVVAEFTSRFKNKQIIIKRIKLPYSNLKE